MMDDCLTEQRIVDLSDVGKLMFQYPFQPIKKCHKMERTFEVQLKEVEVESPKGLPSGWGNSKRK